MTDKELTIEYLNKILKNKENPYLKIEDYEGYDMIKVSLDEEINKRNDVWFEFDKEGNLMSLY
jgi:rRNA pseudouridine-1189 N-methylase Emg1 (Nep1/Mra1 family)